MEEKKLNLCEESLANADGGAYIPTNVLSITDGQIFSGEAANEFVIPVLGRAAENADVNAGKPSADASKALVHPYVASKDTNPA